MEKESEKRYQEFISASKEADDVYHTLALTEIWAFRQCHVDFVYHAGSRPGADSGRDRRGNVYEPADHKLCY